MTLVCCESVAALHCLPSSWTCQVQSSFASPFFELVADTATTKYTNDDQ